MCVSCVGTVVVVVVAVVGVHTLSSLHYRCRLACSSLLRLSPLATGAEAEDQVSERRVQCQV